MNTSRATVALSAIILAAVISLSGHAPIDPSPAADPSVPPASVAFAKADAPAAPQGNVQDLTY